MDEIVEIVFREDSSLLSILREGVQDNEELRMIVGSLVLKEPSAILASDPKLNAIYRLAEMIMKYENFCEGGPMGIL